MPISARAAEAVASILRNPDARPALAPPQEPVDVAEELELPVPGAVIHARIYRNETNRNQPALVWLPGGGFVADTAVETDAVCRILANRSGWAIAAVRYRLAPRHPFPAAFNDALAAVRWLADNAERLGLDRDRMAVGGTSAGGNLSAAVSIHLRDQSDHGIVGQVLVCPALDWNLDTASMAEFGVGLLPQRADVRAIYDQYVGSPDLRQDPRVSPGCVPDVSGLPPTLILIAECDPLRDSGERFADRLARAGVPVTCVRFPSTVHDFISLAGALPEGLEGITLIAETLRTWSG